MGNELFEKIHWYFDSMLFDYIKASYKCDAGCGDWHDLTDRHWHRLNDCLLDRLFFNMIPPSSESMRHNTESIYREVNK